MMFMKPAADVVEPAKDVDCEDDESQTEENEFFWPPGLREKCQNRSPDRYMIAFGPTRKGRHQRQKRFDLPMMTGGVDRASNEDDAADDGNDLHVTCQFYAFMVEQRGQSGKQRGRKYKQRSRQ